MTVGDLKEALATVPDDAVVIVHRVKKSRKGVEHLRHKLEGRRLWVQGYLDQQRAGIRAPERRALVSIEEQFSVVLRMDQGVITKLRMPGAHRPYATWNEQARHGRRVRKAARRNRRRGGR